MNTYPPLHRRSLPAIAVLLVGLLAPARSAQIPAERPASAPLAIAIAVQGNQALRQIREESRESLRAIGLPQLRAPADAAVVASQ